MLDIIFWLGLGALLGWNVLPQPAWIKAIYDRVVAWVRG